MSHHSKKSINNHRLPPKRPPKPCNLNMESEPLYMTTLPEEFQSSVTQFQTPEPRSRHPPPPVKKLGSLFEPPLVQFQQPGSLIEPPVAQFQQPGSLFEPPVAQFQQPGSRFEPPVVQFQQPGSLFEPPVAQVQQPRSQFELPVPQSPTKPTLKGILKNGPNENLPPGKIRSSSAPNFTGNNRPDLLDIRHFDLDIEEKRSLRVNEENQSNNSEESPLSERKNRKKRKDDVNQLNNSLESPLNERKGRKKRKDDVNQLNKSLESPLNERKSRKKPKNKEAYHSQEQDTKNMKQPFQMTSEMREKAAFGARVESIAGIAHLIVIIMSIITLIVLAKLANIWELQLRRCPLYVEVSQNTGVYWGNEKMVACHYAAYMPALILIMSLSLIVFHGGILYSFRSGARASRLLLSRTYPKVIFFIELLELAIAISVASVILDGVRQTCLSFQLSPWTEERPANCRGGYDDRDHVYGITKTYSRLITSIVTSMISVCMLIITSVLYLIRINPCCRGRIGRG